MVRLLRLLVVDFIHFPCMRADHVYGPVHAAACHHSCLPLPSAGTALRHADVMFPNAHVSPLDVVVGFISLASQIPPLAAYPSLKIVKASPANA